MLAKHFKRKKYLIAAAFTLLVLPGLTAAYYQIYRPIQIKKDSASVIQLKEPGVKKAKDLNQKGKPWELFWLQSPPPPPVPYQLSLTGLQSGVHQAYSSIDLEDGFESGTDFTAEILTEEAGVPAASTSVGNSNVNMNWTLARSFDANGNVIGEGKSFYDNNGQLLQSQSKVFYRKDATTTYTHVMATQPLRDAYNRVAASTLAAPIDNSEFGYKADFVLNSAGTSYDYRNFDRFNPFGTETDKTNAPEAVGGQGVKGTLGWYYSTSNQWEPYTPTTDYPYSRQTFYGDGTGNVKKSARAGDVLKMGSGKEVSSYLMPVQTELDHYMAVRNRFFATEVGAMPSSMAKQAVQTIAQDENGREAVMIQDRDGKTLMVARPGNELNTVNTISIQPPFFYSFSGVSVGGSAKNLKVAGGNIRIYESQNDGSSFTLLYSGSAAGFISPATLMHLYKIESDQPFTLGYDAPAAISGSPDRIVCKDCPAQSNDNTTYYFKLLASGVVNITGGNYAIYNMETELPISFTGGGSLNKGYYKIVNTGGTPVSVSYTNSYADVSYNFYNQLGQLIATIAPEGVKKLYNNGYNNYATKADVPFISLNEYDLQGRLISTQDVDGGKSEFVYRKDGKIRFSQNALQRNASPQRYSYTNYDQWGRAIESGENEPSTGGIAFNNNMDPAVTNPMRDILENTTSTGGLGNGTKRDVVMTKYDVLDGTHGLSGYVQDAFYMRGGVSRTDKYSSIVNHAPASTNRISTTWYSYDEEGKILWKIQDINGLGKKTNDYTYDVMGRIIKRVYQKGTTAETFVHYYEYDPLTQNLWKVYTGTVDNGTKTHQATYVYYLHGPLKRVELASDGIKNLQGIDYTYTLDGALKAINNSDKTKDPGNDGLAGDTKAFADAFGMVLDYYADDYKNARAGNYQSIKGVNAGAIANDLYNGSIKAMSWYSQKPAIAGIGSDPTVYVYKYDDKYQFSESTWGENLNFNSNLASFTATGKNKEKMGTSNILPYDANGNIKYLERTNSGGSFAEGLAYHYLNSNTQSGSTTDYNTNQLERVVRTKPDNSTEVYASYKYDKLGQLVEEVPTDATKKKYIRYDVSGKVVLVARDAGFTQRLVEYAYDELGQRVISRNYNPANNAVTNTTYYLGDVIYTQAPLSAPVAQEYLVSGGSGKIGTFYRPSAVYAYEMSDHLGNVRAVLARSGSNMEVRMYSDYYPFGMVIQKAGTPYRYGYQGQYAEDETELTGWNSFELRMYDSRIARWLTVDPYNQYHSPYVGMGNDPVNNVDPNGGFAKVRAWIYSLRVGGHMVKTNKGYTVMTVKGDNNSSIVDLKTFKWDLADRGARWINNHGYVGVTSKTTVGFQVGGRFNSVISAEAGYKVYTIDERKWGYNPKSGSTFESKSDKYGTPTPTEDFIGVELGDDGLIRGNKNKSLSAGFKFSSVYETAHSMSGGYEVENTRSSNLEVTFPFLTKSIHVNNKLKVASFDVHGKAEFNKVPNNFKGLNISFSGKLLLGQEFNIQVGYLE